MIDLKATLEQANIKQTALASDLRISKQQVNKWVTGTNPSKAWQRLLNQHFANRSIEIVKKS